MAWLSGWEKRKKIEVQDTNIDSSLTWFPLMVKLGTSVGVNNEDVTAIFDEVSGSSQKIAITDDTGDTELYVEVEKWDDTAEEAILWVSKDGWSISNSGVTTLYIYYDSSHADNTTYVGTSPDDTPSNNVWDGNFSAVWHMNQSSGSLKDSTSNNNDGTFNGDLPDVARGGHTGDAQDFDGTGDDVTGFTAGSASDVTREAWVYSDDFSNMHGIVSRGDSAWTSGVAHFKCESGTGCSSTNGISWDINDGGGNKLCWESLSTGTWYYVAGTYDSSSGEQTLWGNDSQRGTQNISTGLTISEADYIGNEYDGARNFNGMIDEARISSTVRTDAWLKATYHSNTDNLLDWYAEETNEFSINVSDDISVTESVDTSLGLSIDTHDDLSITDKPFYYSNQVIISEWIGLDVITPTGDLDIDVSDDISISEDTTVSVQSPTDFDINVSDDVSVTEDTTTSLQEPTALEVSVSDQLNLTEDVTISTEALTIEVSDGVDLTEDVSVSLEAPTVQEINVSDQLDITEDVSVSPQAPTVQEISVSDQLDIAEDTTVSIQPTTTPEISVSDQISIAEDVSLDLSDLNIDTNDQLNIAEDITVTTELADISVSDDISLAEDITVGKTNLINVNDQLSLAEDVTVEIQATITPDTDVSDDVSIAEGITIALADSEVSVSDELAISEDVSVSVETPAVQEIDVSDQLSLAEDVTAETSALTTLETDTSDDVSLSESITVALADTEASASDDVSIEENVSVNVQSATALEVNVHDDVGVTEDVTVGVSASEISVYDNITIAEVIYGDWWIPQDKSSASWTAGTKNTANWTEDSKNTASWTEDSKNTTSWTEESGNTSSWTEEDKNTIKTQLNT